MTDGNTYFETRVIDGPGSHCIFLDGIDEDSAIQNISILPTKYVKSAKLCKYDIVGGTSDTLYIRHSTIESSYLHKFLGKNVTFRATSDGGVLPGPVRDEYAYFLDIDCTGRVYIEYEVVSLSKKAKKRRHVISYNDEKYMDFGKSTPGMLKYTLPMSFGGGGGKGGLSKLFAFVPSDATSVEMFLNGEECGCPFVRHITKDGRTYYKFDFGECKSAVDDAVLIVRCDGSGRDSEPMGLIGLEEKLLCFAPVA
jgi:hypothetical protein